ncbi:MAG: Unknown protein [uncultured Thiotrichaceae bacterium]|uniref:Uncharacterized protein n=1 Tax=uncultured Thiotrichaceae bacterium TaxID=298394 RepID=A0A6S6SJY7_9GAMM|nr:MAG: Unknown protein [uncultured Thiotrichaceae bacterium]
MTTPFIGPDGETRCEWCGGAPEFLDYHDFYKSHANLRTRNSSFTPTSSADGKHSHLRLQALPSPVYALNTKHSCKVW